MLRQISAKFARLKGVIFDLLGIKKQFKIGRHEIQLTFRHNLPEYQDANPFYDRFLPHLVKYLPDDSLVIDVGANVGDTLAGMAGGNDKLEYLCIEACGEFFTDLEKNADLLRSQNHDLRVSLVQELVGNGLTGVGLDSRNGTSHAVVGGGDLASRTLLSILENQGFDRSRLSLLKVDVDGFDWDVIRSSYDALTHHPLIYFECQYDNADQYRSYIELFTELMELDYFEFSFFDNFGQYILSTNNIKEIIQLLDYVRRQNIKRSSRTFYYYDILAYSHNSYSTVSKMIEEYVEM